jgi:hypothetical protein
MLVPISICRECGTMMEWTDAERPRCYACKHGLRKRRIDEHPPVSKDDGRQARFCSEPITPANWAELQATIRRTYARLTPAELAALDLWAQGELARLRQVNDDERQARTTDEVPHW